MEISPLQFAGALLSACVVLVIARFTKDRTAPQQFSLRAMLVVMTGAAILLSLVGFAIRS